MAFLESNCLRTALTPSILAFSNSFSCGNEDLDSFFIKGAFTVSNASIFTNYLPNARKKSIGKNIPWGKRDLVYPAVLIGRLGVNSAYKKRHIGSELLDYIKQWFVDPDNKTGCRYLVVDAYNQPVPLSFYERNGFKYMFSSELQECEYRNIDSTTKLRTRMMYFDLMTLSEDKS